MSKYLDENGLSYFWGKIKTLVNAKATTKKWTASVAASAWTADTSRGGYKATVTLSGMASTDKPLVDVRLLTAASAEASEAMLADWALVYGAEALSGSLRLYALEKPEAALPIQVQAVR